MKHKSLIIVNPHFRVQDGGNIFNKRKIEYDGLEERALEILQPILGIGFEITELRVREPRITSGELQRTIKNTLVIKVRRNNIDLDLSLHIPKLIDENYVVINGRRKIPLFQLFDIPIVTRGKAIKFRTNVATVMVIEDRHAPYVYLSILGKKVPLYMIVLCYYSDEEIQSRFDLDNAIANLDNVYGKFIHDMKMYWSLNDGSVDRHALIPEIGKIYTKFNHRDKGESILYAVDLMLEVDPMTKRFMQTESVLDEILMAMQSPGYDDTDIQNKRIRIIDYLVLAKVSKIVFDLCLSNRTSRTTKFNTSSTQILSECNVSDIVQFDFSINPIEELTKLSRCSLVGPGGFKRENVPEHLRDINDTMFGRICPVDTPDRDNCGVLQNLLVNTKLDDNLRFTEDVCDQAPISIPVSMVPFLENDDQTRLQMSSSQMRQSIMLQKFDNALVRSGNEGLYTDKTQFVKRAKQDGEVVFIDEEKYIMVIYDNKETDIFDIASRKIYVGNVDIFNV
ncbi:hypothetical protein KAR91_78285, partial [Candidatus Pacearchaeota archaeon]|nr:hypothetical protein [Candidatus Pacearchaeota archaeon]